MTNISTKENVKEVKRQATNARRQELNDIKTVLSTKSGRRLYWRLLEYCKVFESIWESSARIHYNSGVQDVGHFLLSELVDSDENLLFKIMKENKKEKEND